jgi:hypothetical protein
MVVILCDVENNYYFGIYCSYIDILLFAITNRDKKLVLICGTGVGSAAIDPHTRTVNIIWYEFGESLRCGSRCIAKRFLGCLMRVF